MSANRLPSQVIKVKKAEEMARIRTIKPKFWDDRKIGKLSRDARLLYMGIWTFSDDMGVCIADATWLKSKVFPYDQIQAQQVGKWIGELVANGVVKIIEFNGEEFIYTPTFGQDQIINRPNTDDLNIPKGLIINDNGTITEQSVINHGTITEQSVINHGTITEQSVPIIGEDKEYNITTGSNEPIVCETGPSHASNIDYHALVDFFNSETQGVFGTIKNPLSDKRKGMVNARVKAHGKECFMEMVRKARSSPFLCGQNSKGWKATFDWLIKPNNFEKVISGNYDYTNKRIDTKCDRQDFMRGVAEGIARANFNEQGG